MRSLLFCQVFPLALMSSSIFEFVGKKKGSKKKPRWRWRRGGGRLDRGAINHGHVAAIKTTLASRTVLSRPSDGPLVATGTHLGTGTEKIERGQKVVERDRVRE